ncbi:MAG TPA: hypothetical protein PKY82_02505 [Pyrinomonadaceae bacterium]|nr:hypothetical protein [Pyrinomonadaceae bacterium]
MRLIIYTLTIFIFTVTVIAQKKTDLEAAMNRAEKANTMLKTFFALGSDSIPFQVFQKAKAVAVFNDVTYFNLLLSKMTKGKGLLSVRNGENWCVPTFAEFFSSGFEFKIADKKKFDIVFFIMDDKLIELLKNDGIESKFVSDKRIKLGPIVKGTGADLVLENAWLIYYPFQDGKLSGLEFQSNFFNEFRIGHDNNLNKKIYQKKAQLIISDKLNDLTVPDQINNFRQTIISGLK